MTFEIKATRGTKQMLIGINAHPFRHRKALRSALNEIGSEAVNTIANYIFNPPKTGRIYFYKGREYQASAPGESPANRSGRLAKSGGYKVRNYQEMTVGETAEYAEYLENPKPGSRIKQRPHIIRAVKAKERDTVNTILEHINHELGA